MEKETALYYRLRTLMKITKEVMTNKLYLRQNDKLWKYQIYLKTWEHYLLNFNSIAEWKLKTVHRSAFGEIMLK